MNQTTCSIDGCDRKLVARGYCHRHYCEARRNGMPVVLGTIPVEDRFWSKVDKDGECWNWIARRDANGYGVFSLHGKTSLAHRVSWELTQGEAPPREMEIDHACRNSSCVNPDHLKLADRSRNMQNQSDKGHKGRNGVRGVYWHKANKKWVAQVRHNRKTYYLGQFETIEEAAAVAKEKRLELHIYNDTDRAA